MDKSISNDYFKCTIRNVLGCSYVVIAENDFYYDGRSCSTFKCSTQKLVKRFPDRDITVGMDTALIVGNPSVISSALLLIPAMVILAVILPGNRVMPLGDLSQFVFFIACMVPVFKGNIIRTWLSSVILFGGGLYIASWMTPATNELFQNLVQVHKKCDVFFT